jgi:Spy/CpxP family protein refolding chaperone
VAALAVGLTALTATAQSNDKPQPTPEQKQFRAEMVKKYDTNEDGKLSKEERAKMSDADKQKMKEMRRQAGKPRKGGASDEDSE